MSSIPCKSVASVSAFFIMKIWFRCLLLDACIWKNAVGTRSCTVADYGYCRAGPQASASRIRRLLCHNISTSPWQMPAVSLHAPAALKLNMQATRKRGPVVRRGGWRILVNISAWPFGVGIFGMCWAENHDSVACSDKVFCSSCHLPNCPLVKFEGSG
jgi:hypothetical protein